MSSVVISGDTSGSITLAAPAVAGTNTINLPAAAGTVMVSGNMPAFSTELNANQTVTGGVYTKATQDIETFDTNNNFASSRFTPTVAGYYQINGSIMFNANNSITRSICALYKNGSLYQRGGYSYVANAVGPQSNQINTVVYLNGSTDYVELYGFVEGVGTLSFLGAFGNTWFNGSLIRAA